ncbi:MAG TPA: C39 family peptidase [Chloroflexota bacterium]|nr:C39 family peptidase [Chloroflexota bacterium]
MAGNQVLFWGYVLRLITGWVLRQLLGLVAIGGSLVLLLGLANVVEGLDTRLTWTPFATALGLLGWLGASLLALYALAHLLRLRRDRVVGLWFVLLVVYAVVLWAGGGLPLVPRLPSPPALSAAAEPAVVVAPAPALLTAADAATSRAAASGASAEPPAEPVVPAESSPASLLWVQNPGPVPLWAAPDEDAGVFTIVPPGAYFRVLGAHAGRYRVYYGGDRRERRAGEAWLDAASVVPSDWPQFIRTREATALRREPSFQAGIVAPLPAGVYLEVLHSDSKGWARVFYLGDGRSDGPQVGWITAGEVAPPDVEPERIARFLATAAALTRPPLVWLRVPYISQLDGSPWAAANCGPTSVAMVLEAHGLPASPAEVRRRVMALQGTPNCHDCGAFIQHLAGAVEAYGLSTFGLYQEDGRLRRWTLEDLRSALRAGYPVIPQVKYRLLPGREEAAYYGDHYIVLTGVLDDAFLYNDPIDDGPGYGRLIAGEQLRRAMAASDFPFAAFATGQP